MDQANSTPFTPENEQVARPKRFSTPSFTYFKGDSDPESHLKHFKSVMILHKADDALMCKEFAMTLRGAAQDWFHTLPSESISSFKELAYVFTKEYTSYRMIKKNPDHLYNLRKKSDESLRDYIKRFKAEKKGLLAEHDLYRELTIAPSQTLVEVFVTAERYALWDDDRIAGKKSTKQEDQLTKRAGQRSDGFSNRNKDKRMSHPQGDATAGENCTKFSIPIHRGYRQGSLVNLGTYERGGIEGLREVFGKVWESENSESVKKRRRSLGFYIGARIRKRKGVAL
ncbi:uncharacterized protein LOC110761422 [Prunus avium]|uniref:Uncharacterized protein LOC110761422 n=1 Tax=Prunus avium TaxID=42229 RepID=A0A6P5SZK9_PRUAV|nr:uncharacterized protein LOC110761422 [Prunus avium]